jgi:Xaa-Pro aminopeptidase
MHTYIITNSENSGQPATRYMSGFSGSDSIFIFMTKKPLSEDNVLQSMEWGKLLVDGRYWEQGDTEVQSTGYRVQSRMIDIVKVHKDYTSKQGLTDIIKQYSITDAYIDSRITIYASVLTLQELGLRIVPSPDIFQLIREIKNENEIKKIQRAQKIALEAFDAVQHEIKVGESESYIAARIEFLMKQGGAEKTSFETIVASGANSALPHARSTDKKIETTDSVIVDFGAIYEGYCSDFTRTILMPKASAKLHEIYKIVEEAQRRALTVALRGAHAKDVDLAARNYIESRGYGKYFTHSTGHGVGMAVHEFPHVSFNSESILQKGHVITVEPGIYIPGVGGVRLEEMVIF